MPNWKKKKSKHILNPNLSIMFLTNYFKEIKILKIFILRIHKNHPYIIHSSFIYNVKIETTQMSFGR